MPLVFVFFLSKLELVRCDCGRTGWFWYGFYSRESLRIEEV